MTLLIIFITFLFIKVFSPIIDNCIELFNYYMAEKILIIKVRMESLQIEEKTPCIGYQLPETEEEYDEDLEECKDLKSGRYDVVSDNGKPVVGFKFRS